MNQETQCLILEISREFISLDSVNALPKKDARRQSFSLFSSMLSLNFGSFRLMRLKQIQMLMHIITSSRMFVFLSFFFRGLRNQAWVLERGLRGNMLINTLTRQKLRNPVHERKREKGRKKEKEQVSERTSKEYPWLWIKAANDAGQEM